MSITGNEPRRRRRQVVVVEREVAATETPAVAAQERKATEKALDAVSKEVATKAPASHTHAQSDVTGLVSDLAGKAAAVHGHAIVDVTGLQAALDAKAREASYRTIATASGWLTAGDGDAQRLIGHGFEPLSVALDVEKAPLLLYLDPADFPGSSSLRLRLRAQLAVNDVDLSGNLFFRLRPVSACAGASGGVGYTVGTEVSGSDFSITHAADTLSQATSGDFAFPSAGYYAIEVANSDTVPADCHFHFTVLLQMRNA